MAASTTHRSLQTRGARVLAQFLPLHEEHAPVGFGSRVEDAVLQVGGHVGDAARLAGDGSPLLVAVPLTWAAAGALAVIPRLEGGEPGVGAKDALLERVDRAAICTGRSIATPAELVAAAAAPLGSALASLAQPEGDADAAGALFDLVVAAVTAIEVLERAAAQSSQ